MKGQPPDVVAEHDAGSRQQFSELSDFDAVLQVPLKLDSARRQEVDRVLGIHVLPAKQTPTTGKSDKYPGNAPGIIMHQSRTIV